MLPMLSTRRAGVVYGAMWVSSRSQKVVQSSCCMEDSTCWTPVARDSPCTPSLEQDHLSRTQGSNPVVDRRRKFYVRKLDSTFTMSEVTFVVLLLLTLVTSNCRTFYSLSRQQQQQQQPQPQVRTSSNDQVLVCHGSCKRQSPRTCLSGVTTLVSLQEKCPLFVNFANIYFETVKCKRP